LWNWRPGEELEALVFLRLDLATTSALFPW